MAISKIRLMAMAVLAYLAFAAFCLAGHLAINPGGKKTETGNYDYNEKNGGNTEAMEIKNSETTEPAAVVPDWPEYVLPDSYLVEPEGFLGIDAVVVGKDGYLYEPWYINEYMGYDWVYVLTDDDELMRRVMVLKFIQDELSKRGVAFCVAISVNKASEMPQFIPEFYKDSHYVLDDDYVRPYVRFKKMLKDKGVYHIDSSSLYKSIGLTNSFAKTGTHWNKLASFETTRAVMNEIDRQTGRNIEKLVFDEIVKKKTPAPFYANEQDIFNIGYAGNRQAMKDAISAAGITQSPTVMFTTRPRFERKDLKEARIFIAPTAPDIQRVTRGVVIENPAFEVALARAIVESNNGDPMKDLDSHSMDAMFQTQSELIQVLAKVDGVVSVEATTGPNNGTFSDAGVWFTVYRVTFFGGQ